MGAIRLSQGYFLAIVCLYNLVTVFGQGDVLMSCSFDNGQTGSSRDKSLCSFVQDQGDSRGPNDSSFDWELNSGSSPSAETGPQGDNTDGTGTGYYVYIETSDPQEQATSARIHTPNLNYRGSICVQFAYYMYGVHIDKLRLYSQFPGGSGRVTRWELQGNQGQQWVTVRQDIEITDNSQQVGFEAFKGNDYQGDIALDDVKVTRGRCDGGSVTTQSTTTTTTTTTTTPAPSAEVNLPYSCNFPTTSLCNFEQSKEDSTLFEQDNRQRNYDWLYSDGPTDTTGTGPSSPHSRPGFMYLETSDPSRENDYATISTPSIQHSGQICLEVYTHLYGDDMGTLRIYRTGQSRNSAPYSSSGNKGDSWQRQLVDFTINRGDKIYFDGARGRGIKSDMAIDSLRLRSGRCQGSVTPTPTTTERPSSSGDRDLPWSCTFENDFCGMFQRTNDQFDWTRINTPTNSEGTGPNSAYQGSYYIYTEASDPRNSGDRSYIETPSLRNSGEICVRFAYHMRGGEMGQLIAFTSNRGEGNSFFRQTEAVGNEWRTSESTTTISFGERVVFLGIVGNGVQSDMSIDDLRIRNGRCGGIVPTPTPSPTPTPTPGPSESEDQIMTSYSCNMESSGTSSSNCRIRQDTGDSMQWTQGRERTPSGIYQRKIQGNTFRVTGPENAHGGSYYIYTEASNARSGDMAKLVFEGSDFSRSGNNCLRFWYMMNGFHMGKLSVIAQYNNGQRITMWSMDGDYGPEWKRAGVEVNMNDIQRLEMETTMTGKFSGDMALDDLTMNSGRCESIPSGFLFRCNFELSDGAASLCGMQQDTRDTNNFDFTLHTSDTPSDFTGPDRAATGSYYIFIEASKPRVRGDRARSNSLNPISLSENKLLDHSNNSRITEIYLPRLNRSGQVCVEFQYHMFGHHIGSLSLVTKSSFDDSNARSQWTIEGDQGNNWKEQRHTIENIQSNDQIGFEGVRGGEYSGDIALDNVRVRSGRC